MAAAVYVQPGLLSLDSSGVSKSLELKAAVTAQLRMLTRPKSAVRVTLPSKPVRFRGSSMPHCPLLTGIDAACNLRGVPRTTDTTFMLDFFASQGTALHELIQKWLGVQGLLLGRWSCQHHDPDSDHQCGTILPSPVTNDVALGPQFHCGHPMRYEEIDPHCSFQVKVADQVVTVEFGGHCDGVLLINGKYLILEVKTKSTSAIRDIRTRNLPLLDHYHQANAYRYTVPLYTQIPEDQFHDFMVVWYFDRADVSNNEPVVVPFNRSVFEREVEAHAVTDYLIKNRMWDKLIGICQTADARPYCPHNNLCFGPNRAADLSVVFQGLVIEPTLEEVLPNV